jgi:hypothetical protein
MTLYYKATRPDGTDFRTGSIDYGAALLSGEVIRHPAAKKVRNDPSTYLSVSVEPADCTGFSYPCRLFRVEPVGRVMAKLKASRNKRAVSALRVVEELPAWQAFGPNGEAVIAFLERCWTMTEDQALKLDVAGTAAWIAAWTATWNATSIAARTAAGAPAWAPAWAAAWDAAWDAAGTAARYAARDAARAAAIAAARDAGARDAALAILVRDKITPAQYATLTQPFVDAGLGEWVA